MSAIILLLGISLLVASGFLIAFIWSVKHGQYDDDYTPSVRMLFDNKTNSTQSQTIETKDTTQDKLNKE
jgi:cbb3-type cytochrome oxidase maturation protein